VNLQAKEVRLKAQPNVVAAGKTSTLRAVVSPCQGHERQPIEFQQRSTMTGNRRWRTVAIKQSDDNCMTKVQRRILRRAVFRAISLPDTDHLGGRSNVVKVRSR
jgi:hypothetical protein